VEVEVEIPAGDMAINSEEKLPQAIWLCAEVWQRDWQAEVNTSRDGLRG